MFQMVSRVAWLLISIVVAYGQSPDQLAFFEKSVRPLLAEKCYACHSAKTMAMGELRLDSKAAVLKGGSRGAAIVAADPDASLLVKAIRYRTIDLRMPPTGKLADSEIADIETWIEMGAPDPRGDEPAPQVTQKKIDLEGGRQFWSFQPVRDPAAPEVRDPAWVRGDVDRFILAKLASNRFKPAAEADRRTLLRRLTFDLTGLPPSPEEIDQFLGDSASNAYEKVVDRLLASPHYGERWGRHWLDLVRWAETNGHEFDNNKLDAWRYRDYVIEAFNSDLPYNQFLKEQIAGDLMPERLSADGVHAVNPIASGTFWLWEVLNSPTDSVKARADQIDNQIDVISKATQGLTVACARCHDHKFDPIPTADYYSMFGIFQSTHMSEKCVDSPQHAALIRAANRRIGDIQADVKSHVNPALKRRAAALAERYMGAIDKITAEDAEGMAAEFNYALTEPSHPLFLFSRVAEPGSADFKGRLDHMRGELREWVAKADRNHPIWAERGDELYDDFESGYGKWELSGSGFGDSPVQVVAPNLKLSGYAGQSLASSFGNGADTLVGTLTTQKFRMPARYVHVRMAGPTDAARDKNDPNIRFTVIADEHKSANATPDVSGRLKWRTLAMTKERGRTCSLEIIDRDREGSIVIDQIVFSDNKEAPPIARKPNDRIMSLLARDDIASLEDLAQAYQQIAIEIAESKNRTAVDEALLASLLGLARLEEAIDTLDEVETRWANDMFEFRAAAVNSVPPSTFAMTSKDYEPADSPIHVRGNHKNPGEIAPRQFLQIVAGDEQKPFTNGSGRLEFANWVASEQNPLTARVMVNRVWKHHFGKGIVATPDNFGKMGARPSHPDLLDHLATRFVKRGWSVKDLQRYIVLSSAYRQSSEASAEAQERDPDNQWLSYMPVRRLEAEAIRDSVLVVAGTLDRTLGGPGVPPHISEFQDGRGKPATGPLDGDGRRSVYVQVRRNFLTPLFLAFDYPLPISTIGRRGVSAVPSQALILLNNEFINTQAANWAQREIEIHERPDDRIGDMYVRAFGREPLAEEVSEIREFLSKQGQAQGERQAWTDLAHALLNTSEFIFIR